MRREIDFEKLFQYIKQNIIEAEGIVENDLEYDSEYDFDELEDQVNFWASMQRHFRNLSQRIFSWERLSDSLSSRGSEQYCQFD